MNTVLFGQFLALLAALSGSVSSVTLNKITQKTNSDVIAFLRMLIAFPILVVWALSADGLVLSQIAAEDLLIMLLSGFVGFFITDLYMFRALAKFGANQTMVVLCFAPILSTLFSSLFFNEKLGLIQFAGVLCTTAGVIIMALGEAKFENRFFSYGFICALASAVLQSASDMLTKAAVGQIPFTTSAAIRAFGGLVGWLFFAALRLRGRIKEDKSARDFKFWCMFMSCILIWTVAGTTCSVGALKYAPAGIVTSLKQMSPVLILPYDFFILKKRSWSALAGTFIAVLGVILFFV